MNAETQLFGRLMAFAGIVNDELESLRATLAGVAVYLRSDDETRAADELHQAVSRVRFIARQCANVTGSTPSPSPLQERKV